MMNGSQILMVFLAFTHSFGHQQFSVSSQTIEILRFAQNDTWGLS